MMEATVHKIGIIMNGVTGRMGTNQHLLRSIAEIIKQGGVKVSASEFIMPDPVLVGRDPIKLEKLAQQSGVTKFTTKLQTVMEDPYYQIYFDSQTTGRRADGVMQDKLWLPGILKLKRLIQNGFFGEILSVRGEFGYWVFEGHSIPAQRPSWNYRKEDDGGIIVDMLCHWRYLLDNVF